MTTTPETTTVDLLVIGSGTGLAAALAAHEVGLSTVVVEKTEYVGGSMALSGGAFWIPANPILRAEGTIDTRERAEQYLASVVGDSTAPERWQSYLEHGPATVELLQRATPLSFMWSKNYSDYHPEHPGGQATGRTCESKPFDVSALGEDRDKLRPTGMAAPVPMPITGTDYRWMNLMTKVPTEGLSRVALRVAQGTGGKLFGKEYVAGGQAIAAGLYAGVLQAGIPVWRETSLTRLISDDDGRITGAELEHAGRTITVTTRKGVVLAAGGFDHDMAMRRKHQSPALGEWSLGSPGNTGDAISLAQDVGATTDLLEEAWWFPAVAPLPGAAPGVMLAERSLPGSFIVDSSGKRFINESCDYMTFGQQVLAREQAGDPVGDMWIIFDQAYRNSYVFAADLFPRMPIPQQWYDEGIAHRGETIEELAGTMGYGTLPETFHRFNILAQAGTDDDFHRGGSAYDRYYGDPTQYPNPNLRPLSKGPFYAVKMVTSDLGTCGGIKADGLGRALREDDSAIDGLYAIGNTAANAFGNRYPGAGATIGSGMVYGYIAARHAAGVLA